MTAPLIVPEPVPEPVSPWRTVVVASLLALLVALTLFTAGKAIVGMLPADLREACGADGISVAYRVDDRTGELLDAGTGREGRC